MRSRLMIVSSVGVQKPPQMSFIKYNDMVQALPAYRANQSLHMVIEESSPGLGGRLLMTNHVSGNSGLGYLDTEHLQLTMDSRGTQNRRSLERKRIRLQSRSAIIANCWRMASISRCREALLRRTSIRGKSTVFMPVTLVARCR